MSKISCTAKLLWCWFIQASLLFSFCWATSNLCIVVSNAWIASEWRMGLNVVDPNWYRLGGGVCYTFSGTTPIGHGQPRLPSINSVTKLDDDWHMSTVWNTGGNERFTPAFSHRNWWNKRTGLVGRYLTPHLRLGPRVWPASQHTCPGQRRDLPVPQASVNDTCNGPALSMRLPTIERKKLARKWGGGVNPIFLSQANYFISSWLKMEEVREGKTREYYFQRDGVMAVDRRLGERGIRMQAIPTSCSWWMVTKRHLMVAPSG